MRLKQEMTLGGLILVMLLSGCSASNQFSAGKGNKFKYSYRLVQPAGDSLVYRDDSVKVQFRFDEAAIRFQLQNLTRSDLRIDWPQPAIGIEGQFFAARHADNLYGDSLSPGGLNVIPSSGFMRNLLIPDQNMVFDGRRWIERDLLPTCDDNDPAKRGRILGSAGKRITVLLRMAFGSTEKSYRFEFAVDSVRQIAWRDYRPLKRTPPPPHLMPGAGGDDQITAAVITVGVLGFSAFLLSAKKSPPTE